LNREIGKLITDLNQRPFSKLEGNRRQWFERLDQPPNRTAQMVVASRVWSRTREQELVHDGRFN